MKMYFNLTLLVILLTFLTFGNGQQTYSKELLTRICTCIDIYSGIKTCSIINFNINFITTDQRSCVAAGFSRCCVEHFGCRTSGGCYCDSYCHTARDCCPDVNLTCPGIALVLACSSLETKIKAPMWQIIAFMDL